MKITALLICFFIVVLSFGVKAEGFSSMIEDLPLMDALYEDRDNSLLFDKPSGRIIELFTYSETLTVEQVLRFYAQALPALGWNKKNSDLYMREGEQIKIDTEQQDKILYVTFTLTPVEN